VSRDTFQFEVPVSFFEKAGAPKGKRWRIGGIVSTDRQDKQKETILQRSLDFSEAVSAGWFNNNHGKKLTDVLGYPENVDYFRKGQTLPDGTTATRDGHWAEGYLLETTDAKKVWEMGKALQGTPRRLGFSVEGKILQRTGPKKKTIAKAMVRNIAITHCPVNPDTKLELLSKSLESVESGELEVESLDKALAMGPANPGGPPATSGQVLATESLERDVHPEGCECEGCAKKRAKKSLTDAEAISWVQDRLPNASLESARRFVAAARALKRQGKL